MKLKTLFQAEWNRTPDPYRPVKIPRRREPDRLGADVSTIRLRSGSTVAASAPLHHSRATLEPWTTRRWTTCAGQSTTPWAA